MSKHTAICDRLDAPTFNSNTDTIMKLTPVAHACRVLCMQILRESRLKLARESLDRRKRLEPAVEKQIAAALGND